MSRLFAQMRLRLRSLFNGTKVDQELDEELQYHLDREIQERLAAGMPERDARSAALRALGAITQNKEACRDTRSVNLIEDLTHDIRYGIRVLWANPAFTVAALVALALGIGANATMFTVAYGVLLRPLPYTDADRIAAVYMNYPARDSAFGTMCVRDFLTWKEYNRAFEEPALFRTQRADVSGDGSSPEQVQGASVTAGFFSMLGVQPVIGRSFTTGEDQPGAASLALISESIWKRRFNGSPNILGQTILFNGVPFNVIGVMPSAFQLPRAETEVWSNLILNPPTRYGPWFFRGIARLKPGVTFEQAQAELDEIGLRMAQQNPYYKTVKLPALRLRDALVGTPIKGAILVLAAAVGLVLLIAVVNVANLMLARAATRRREMALRLSLGAGRGRLIRQLLTESMFLSVIGGLAGFGLAWLAIALIRFWNPGQLPLLDLVRVDAPVLVFIVCVCTLATVLFGLAPALQSMRTDTNSTLRESGRSGTASPGRAQARSALVVCEVALSLMLLVGAGLLLRSFMNLQQVKGGFSNPPHQLLTMSISPGDPKYNDVGARLAFYNEVLRQARSTPGVQSATITDSLPPDRLGNADSFQIEGQTLPAGEMNPVVSAVTASPDLFRTLGLPLVKGRYFTDYDTHTSAPVVIVSDAFARRFFPNQEVLGKRIRQGQQWMEIVGVVGNVKYMGLTMDTDPAYYMPFAQAYARRMMLVVRSIGDAAPLAADLRSVIQGIDSSVTLAQVSTMEQVLSESISRPRFNTGLLTLFAAIALSLAAIGIYGLISYSVAQRTQEIGVRMALGAARTDVMRMVIGQGASLAAIGIIIGSAGAMAGSRLLQTMVFGISVMDAITFVAAPVGIMLVVLAATFIPALRAMRISPMAALRYE